MAKTVSGKQVVRILVKHFGFRVVSQRGSHIKLERVTRAAKLVTIVPNHRELARGTLRGALRLAQVRPTDFWDYL